MVDSKNKEEGELIKTLIQDQGPLTEHLNLNVSELMKYIEPVLLFKEEN